MRKSVRDRLWSECWSQIERVCGCKGAEVRDFALGNLPDGLLLARGGRFMGIYWKDALKLSKKDKFAELIETEYALLKLRGE